MRHQRDDDADLIEEAAVASRDPKALSTRTLKLSSMDVDYFSKGLGFTPCSRVFFKGWKSKDVEEKERKFILEFRKKNLRADNFSLFFIKNYLFKNRMMKEDNFPLPSLFLLFIFLLLSFLSFYFAFFFKH